MKKLLYVFLIVFAFSCVSNGEEVLIDSYPVEHYDAESSQGTNHPSADGNNSAQGEAFTASETFALTKARFYYRKIGSPTGTAYARLYAATGTVGSNAVPTGSALASSAGYDISTIPDTLTLIDFDFSGDPYEPQQGTAYCIIMENPSSGISVGNILSQGLDASSPTYAGNEIYYTNGAWATAGGGYDRIFYVYGTIVAEHPTPAQVLRGGEWFNEGVLQHSDWPRLKRGISE